MFPFICSVLQHVALVIMSMNRPGSQVRLRGLVPGAAAWMAEKARNGSKEWESFPMPSRINPEHEALVEQVAEMAQTMGAVFTEDGEPFRCGMRALDQVQMALVNNGAVDVNTIAQETRTWIREQGDRWWLSLPVSESDHNTTEVYSWLRSMRTERDFEYDRERGGVWEPEPLRPNQVFLSQFKYESVTNLIYGRWQSSCAEVVNVRMCAVGPCEPTMGTWITQWQVYRIVYLGSQLYIHHVTLCPRPPSGMRQWMPLQHALRYISQALQEAHLWSERRYGSCCASITPGATRLWSHIAPIMLS